MTNFETDTDDLRFLCEDGVATFTLNREQTRNALTRPMTDALRRGVAWAATSPEVGAVVLTGAGSAFCSGADVKAMGERRGDASLEEQFQEMRARHHELAGALRAMRKPSIAALPGAAAGAGMALALACDLRIASDSAFLSTGYARIGLSGDYGIAWLLTRIVGGGRARELMLTSERVTPDKALAIGLVNRIVPAADLARETRDLARELASGPRIAFAYMKDNLDEALGIDHATAIDREADRLMKARSTRDHREAVAAFAEKRTPKFTGN
ncbi:MAG: enoyl-CoA hydratase/isomerase family protein [Pseudomonadales bacterium]|nr:enoyl-CoA hydratase/isomerase family protein [Pseudomonadales bacterium]